MKPEVSTVIQSPEPDKLIHNLPQRPNTDFKGDVLRLASGTGLAQVIAVLAAPILARIYAPEAFGIAALFTSITTIIGVLACMRYEQSIVLPDNDCEAANLLAVSMSFAMLNALLIALIVWLGGPHLLRWVRITELEPYLWLIPVTVLFGGIFTAMNYWSTRAKYFTWLSIARVTSVVTSISATLGVGFAGYSTGGAMIAASIGGQAVATTVLGGQIWRNNGRFLVQSITWRKMWAGMKQHKKFPMFSSFSALLNAASWQLPVVMLGVFFSPVVVGFYSLGFRILQMPMSLIGSAVGQVFFQRAVDAKIEGTLKALVENGLKKLVRISLFPFLTLAIVGKDLFTLFFGSGWSEAGIYAQIFSPWAVFWFASSPLSTIVIVLQRQDIEFRLSLLSLIMRISSITIGGFLSSAYLAISLFSLSGVLISGYLCLVVTRLVGIPLRRTISFFLFEFLLFLPFGVGIIVIGEIFSNVWITIGFASIVVAWRTVPAAPFKNLIDRL